MARPREFDQELVLDQAMHLFWEKGYERTSIQDLCKYTGIHRGSLYDTFGDKHELFLTCLDRFWQNAKGHSFFILEEPGAPKEVLERFFEMIIDNAMRDEKHRRGCFMINVAAELAPMDPNISKRVEAYNLSVENLFYSFLLRAQQAGSIKSKHSLRQLSRFLANTRQGLFVMGKSATDRKVLQDVYKVALSFIT
ncbi:TetR/AcrR family transcriptional regulator [Paenibacillus agricola]|uniref:TetR/AcrR family transcriptional regulator n=1 Tax=Paenibacillus agricola TaxID=2716264 RepID=A0ABX0JGM2_9BACL|nr:TetR/AcrR family transcriptional regulator [Paenibacillus agricola]NHN34047.1 TetR/AcrR family transcriptional regulator [Paenibacillus agricola]